MESIISDLLDTIQSPDVPHATRQISFELLIKLADEGSTEARSALARLGRKAKRRKSTSSRATFGDAAKPAKLSARLVKPAKRTKIWLRTE